MDPCHFGVKFQCMCFGVLSIVIRFSVLSLINAYDQWLLLFSYVQVKFSFCSGPSLASRIKLSSTKYLKWRKKSLLDFIFLIRLPFQSTLWTGMCPEWRGHCDALLFGPQKFLPVLVGENAPWPDLMSLWRHCCPGCKHFLWPGRKIPISLGQLLFKILCSFAIWK